jgi:hypothetical protein
VALPIDAIVPIYYSASVNIASTNSQSLHPNMVPCQLLHTEQGLQLKSKDKRLFQKLDNVFESFPGLNEVIAIYELLTHKVIPKMATQTITVSESQLRKPRPAISTQTISMSGVVSRLASISKTLTGTVSISEVCHKVSRALFTESVTIVEFTVLRGLIPKPITEVAITILDLLAARQSPNLLETIVVSELLTSVKARLFLFLTGSVTVADSASKILKAKRAMIEGRCSILFSGSSS